jgi:quinolinate synthase
MKLTRLQDVLRSLREGTYEVQLEERVMRDARHALDEMLHAKVPSNDRVR